MIASALAVLIVQSAPMEFEELKACLTVTIAVEAGLQEGRWAGLGTDLPPLTSARRTMGLLLLTGQIFEQADARGVAPEALGPELEPLALARMDAADDAAAVAALLAEETACFARAGAAGAPPPA